MQVNATRKEASALEEARKAEAAAAYAAAAEARELSKMLSEVETQLSQERCVLGLNAINTGGSGFESHAELGERGFLQCLAG